MAAFTTRTLDQSLKRGSRRAALGQWWTTQGENSLGLTPVGGFPHLVISDGTDIWVGNNIGHSVSRVRASDGKLLETWSDVGTPNGMLVAMGKVFIAGGASLGRIYQIDPTQAAGAASTLTTGIGNFPAGIAYDGQRIWTANCGPPASVSIVSLNPTTVTNVTTGFSCPVGILFDGSNIWVTDGGDDTLKKLDSNGVVLQSIPMGGTANPQFPAFDGTNIWVPNFDDSTVAVVRAVGGLSGTVLATLSGNGLNRPITAAFDGERILVTNFSGNSVSLWKATDFTPIGTFFTGEITSPFGACSDGINFWITLSASNKLARF
jgi:DNA-binding beta-propeller fold protein YncE